MIQFRVLITLLITRGAPSCRLRGLRVAGFERISWFGVWELSGLEGFGIIGYITPKPQALSPEPQSTLGESRPSTDSEVFEGCRWWYNIKA